MTKIVVGDLHEQLMLAGVPIVSVRLPKADSATVELVFQDGVTPEQKAAGEKIAAEYDQDAVDEQKPKPVTMDDINSAKSVADLKALMIRMYEIKG